MSRESTRKAVTEARRCQKETQAFEVLAEVKREAETLVQTLRAAVMASTHSPTLKSKS